MSDHSPPEPDGADAQGQPPKSIEEGGDAGATDAEASADRVPDRSLKAGKRGSETILGVAPQSPERPITERPPPMMVRSGDAKSDLYLGNLASPPLPLDPAVVSPSVGAGAETEPADAAAQAGLAGQPVEPQPQRGGSNRKRTAQSFADALCAKVKIGSVAVPLWLPSAGAAVLLFAIGVGIGAGAGARDRAAPQASGARHALEAAPVDQATLKTLEAKAEASLSSAEVLTLTRGRRERELRAAVALRDRLAHAPYAINDPAVAAEFRALAVNRDTAGYVLGAAAALPGSVGPDILYDVWTGTAEHTEATELARRLVYSKDVRRKASAALNVALDLRTLLDPRKAGTCANARDLLGPAREHGDLRSLHLLRRLAIRSGCGPTKQDDCYPCLREGDDLKKAIAAVASRPAPKPLASR